MEPTSEERRREPSMPVYSAGDDGLDGYARMPDGSVNPIVGQNWHHHNAPAAPGPVASWNHGHQPPSRQHTPNTAPHFDPQATFAHYSNAFGAGLPATSPLQQPAYSWNGFDPSGYGNNALDPSLSLGFNQHQHQQHQQRLHQQQHQQQHFHNPAAFQHTIAPSALENVSTSQLSGARANSHFSTQSAPAPPDVPQASFQIDVPSGAAEGSFLIIPQASLSSVTESKSLSQFLDLGVDPQEFVRVSRSTTTPAAPRRKSRNAIKKLASSDPKLLAKLAKGKSKLKAHKAQVKAQRIPAPRLPLARAGSAISTPSSVDSASEDDSEYDSSDDELDIIESPPYAAKRPDEPSQAVAYDTIKAVWLPRRKQPTPDQIREGLRAFWEVLKTIRDRWKSDGDVLKKAEEAKKTSEVPMLKDRVKSQRTMLEAALVAALEHGHPEVLRLMGENRPFLQMSYVFMADRVKDSDVNGLLSRQLLKVLVRCTTITQEALEEFKLKKVLALYTKRGDEEISKLVKQIEDVGAAASKEKVEKTKPDQPTVKKEVPAPSKTTAPTNNRVPQPAPIAGVKRAQPGDPATNSANRVMGATTGTSKSSNTTQKASPLAADKKFPPSGAVKTSTPTATKPVNMYAGLKAASKKPGTALVEKKLTPAAQTAEKKVAAAPPPKTSATPAWSFKDYMADLSKPKEPEKPKEVKPERGPETEEQKRKRERKEARRSLHVQFKTGSALEEIRVFEHDPEEESGHDASMTRDVGDVQSEGRMFKQHIEQMDLDGEMDMDIDDDNESPGDTERLIDHGAPLPVDFNDIDNQQRLSNYYKLGGYKHAISKERDLQDKHESSTLLAVYLSSADVPPNPREPVDPFDGEYTDETKDFGAPPQTVQNRAAHLTWQSTAPAWPMPIPTPTPAAPSTGAPSLTPDLNAILASLSNHNSTARQPGGAAPAAPLMQPPTGQQAQATTVPTGFENLFATFQKFSQPTQNVAPQQQPAPQAAPQPAPAADLGALLASLQSQQPGSQPQAPTQAPAPVQPPYASMDSQAPGATATPMDWAAMMAAWAQTGVPLPPMPGMPGMPGMPDFSTPMQQSNSSGGYEHPDRKRMLEGADDKGDSGKKGNWDNGGGKKKWNKGEKPKFVLPCKFFKDGKCTKGAACTYLHE